MPDRFALFAIRLEGTEAALARLEARRQGVLDAIHDSLLLASLAIRGRIVGSFGTPGYPRRATGALSRGVRSFAERTPLGARAVVGVAAAVPYARILELGGVQPARTILPRRKKALRWTTGQTHASGVAALDKGKTYKQAFGAPRSRRGRALQAPDTQFSRRVFQPSRYQRAIPYLGPAFELERAGIERTLRERIALALR